MVCKEDYCTTPLNGVKSPSKETLVGTLLRFILPIIDNPPPCHQNGRAHADWAGGHSASATQEAPFLDDLHPFALQQKLVPLCCLFVLFAFQACLQRRSALPSCVAPPTSVVTCVLSKGVRRKAPHCFSYNWDSQKVWTQ